MTGVTASASDPHASSRSLALRLLGALATRLLDPLITFIAADFATSVSAVVLLSSAFALPFGLSQPFLGPAGDTFGKVVVIKVAIAVVALGLLASLWPPI